MSLDPGNIIVGTSDGPGLWVAPVGTTPPVGGAAIDENDWTPVGYISDDETPTLGQELTAENFGAWQASGPVRSKVTDRSFTLGFTVIEHNEVALSMWLDTAEPTPDAAGSFSIDLPSGESQPERAAIMQVRDGDTTIRWHFYKTVLSEAGDASYEKGALAGLPITLQVLDTENGPGTFHKIVYLEPTGVTPGTPGSFTPAGSTPPEDLTALQALGALGETTAWTTGEYVVLGDASSAYWDGDSWESGTA
jgi:hypothetical protein